MNMRCFFVDKETGTPADTLLAFGVTDFLDHLIPQDAGDVGMRIEDLGDCYGISLNTAVLPEWVEEARFFAIIPGLNTKTKKTAVPYAVDYLEEQQRNSAYFEGRKNDQDDEQLRAQGIHPPNPDWPVWAVINQMSATASYNKMVELWQAHESCFPQLAAIILKIVSSRPNQVDTAIATWKQLAKKQEIKGSANMAQLQVVNPGMGKGGNRSKATGLGIGGLNGFWLLEYLKFAGLYRAAIPRVVRGEKDRKTYVLRPNKLNWRTHNNVFPEFQKSLYAQTAVKMDILANFTYCRTFLTQWQNAQGGRRAWQRANPGNHVAAIETIYYKHLGSAHATLNLSSLSLPEWLGRDVTTKEEAQTFLDLLDEHNYIIYRLDEKKGNEYSLLRQYRHFLSGRDLKMFYRFTGGYSAYLMSEMAKGNKPPQFSTTRLEVLIMVHDRELSPILQDQGFKNVAQAIRLSTVRPLYLKSEGKDPFYEIRFGLGDKLIRKAQYRDEFAVVLSRFMFDFNKENARKRSEAKKRGISPRYDLSNEDVEKVIALMDEYEPSTVAHLLVAYGYAFDASAIRK